MLDHAQWCADADRAADVMDGGTPPDASGPRFQSEEPRLHRAARLGDHDAIRELVAAGIPVDDLFNIRLDRGARPQLATPLMVAAGSSDGATVETVKLLLGLGASIEPGPSGMSALSFACEGLWLGYPPGGDAARAGALLAAGADPDVTGGNGMSVLARAAGSGDVERVTLLLAAGANPRPAAESAFQFPLHRAVERGLLESVRALIGAGVDVNERTKWDDPILASASSEAMLTALLEAGADLHAVGFKETSIVERVACNGEASIDERISMLRRLVQAGVDLDARTPNSTAIASAAMSGNAGAVEVLLSLGADPGIEPNALGYACFAFDDKCDPDMERVIDLLVGAGMNPNDRDALGYGPLHGALSDDAFMPDYAESDGINVAASVALIRNGASIDITFPETGYRPLHAAALASSAILIEVLLAAGADPAERATDGSTPIDVARRAGADDCARLLESAATGQ